MTTFGDLARRNGAHWAEKDAYVELDRKVTWREFNTRTDALGAALRRHGVAPGDRVAILSADCIEVAEVFIACAKIGAVRVGINPRLAPAEVASLVSDCTPAILFYPAEQRRVLETIAEKLSAMGSPPTLIGFGGTHGCAIDYEELIAANVALGPLEQTPHETVMIAYTTGSTGLPKGAIYPHQKFLQSILYTALNEGLVHDAVWLHAMPAAGVPMMHLLRNLFTAATTVIVGPWDAERALHLIERDRVTNCVLVPTMLNSLLAVPDLGRRDLTSMQLLGYGASPLPPATIKEAMAVFNCPFLQMYGTTELLGMSNMLFPSDHQRGLNERPEILASAGRPLSYVDTRIIDEDGRDVAIGETGEYVVRSDVVFPGYWNAPEKTAESMTGEWLLTGDLARRDEEGYIYLSDRAKFRIKTGGYNVFPTEIENVLAEHPAVDEVSAFGLPDPVWGDRIEAVVSLKPDAAATPEELREYCRDKIANFKIPKKIEIWGALPKGVTGKIQKRTIIDMMQKKYEAGS
jgi:acyl-CoA synthetase (AMP-forming)/AMP-acid ligase II